MTSLIARYAAALLGTACVVEGYWVYLQKTVMSPAREFQQRHDRWVSEAGDSLERWLQARAGAAGIRSEILSTEQEVIVSFRVPGLQADTLKVSVGPVRVTISCVASLTEEVGGAGGGYRREAVRQYEMVMPLPANADPARHRVVRDGESFRIIFDKVEDPSLKS